MSKAVAKTGTELTGHGDYNHLSVTLYKDDRTNQLELYFNPEIVEQKDGYATSSFMLFSNGAKRINTGRVCNRITEKARMQGKAVLQDKAELVAMFKEVTETNKFPTMELYPNTDKALNQFKPYL